MTAAKNPFARNRHAIFTQASHHHVTQAPTGLRPTTPDSVPILGPTAYENLLLNTGHGTLGWTHGAGSGRALAALMSGQPPELEFAYCGR